MLTSSRSAKTVLTHDRKDNILENKPKKEVTGGHYNAQSLQSNLLDKRTTFFCIFPSLLFGRLYWIDHLLFFPANIDHSSSCFLDAVFSIYQYLFCSLLADCKLLTFLRHSLQTYVLWLASGTQLYGFEPGRSRWIFTGVKILSMPSFGGDVKESVTCPSFAACQRT